MDYTSLPFHSNDFPSNIGYGQITQGPVHDWASIPDSPDSPHYDRPRAEALACSGLPFCSSPSDPFPNSINLTMAGLYETHLLSDTPDRYVVESSLCILPPMGNDFPSYLDGMITRSTHLGPTTTQGTSTEPQISVLVCVLCNKTFFSQPGVDACFAGHFEPKAFPCYGVCGVPFCLKSYASKELLKRHCTPLANRMVVCLYCGQIRSKQNISRHKKSCSRSAN